MRRPLGIALLLLGATPAIAQAPTTTIVFCAPGYPGTTSEAQASMDAFARSLGTDVGAVYHETEAGGLARLAAGDAGLALVTLPFFVKHRAALGLEARLLAVPAGTDGTETWSLAARKGRVVSASSLDGFEIVSLAAYAPEFVRGAALAAWGPLPASVRFTESGQVLSALRRAARDEKVAVLLDGPQSAALPTLPFAVDLEIVARSAPLPSAIVCTVGRRLPDARWKTLVAALSSLRERPEGRAALEALRIERFAPLGAVAARLPR